MNLSIEELSFAYGDVQALEAITVAPETGRLTAILGPNASGKSTLLRCIMGSLRPQHGLVRINGQPAHLIRARRLARHIAYVAQRSNVAAAFSVREVIELGRYALTPDRARVEEAIERLDLCDVAARPYEALSVGQQQRVMLARAVAQLETDGLLLLDEPTSAMDLRHVRDTVHLLGELVAEGVTVIMVMHDVSLAATVAQEVWLLDQGKLVASGPAADVLNVETLNAVFKVPFDWFESAGGDRLLASRRTTSPP